MKKEEFELPDDKLKVESIQELIEIANTSLAEN